MSTPKSIARTMQSRCPHLEPLRIDSEDFLPAEIIEVLSPLVSVERKERIATTLDSRTYNVTPVMEGLYDRGNVSAVLRSAEALGYQSAHIIQTSPNFKKAKRVTQGAEKWLDIQVWESTVECVRSLKSLGYKVLATCLEGTPRPIAEIDFTEPAALVFGNEKDGVSRELLSLADERVSIPLLGFSQSFNISVAAALSLYHANRDRVARGGRHGDLTADERDALTAIYYFRSVGSASQILIRARKDASGNPMNGE